MSRPWEGMSPRHIWYRSDYKEEPDEVSRSFALAGWGKNHGTRGGDPRTARISNDQIIYMGEGS